jgi:hypothetical protein
MRSDSDTNDGTHHNTLTESSTDRDKQPTLPSPARLPQLRGLQAASHLQRTPVSRHRLLEGLKLECSRFYFVCLLLRLLNLAILYISLVILVYDRIYDLIVKSPSLSFPVRSLVLPL